MKQLFRLRTLGLVALAAAASLLVVACGDDTDAESGGGTATTTATTTTPDATGTTGTDASTTPGTIVDVAVSNPDFSILVAAVKKAGLVETLSGPGPFTVFAPTNAAFAKALTDLNLTEEQLLASPDLGKILTYHVLPGKTLAADITGPLSPATVEGSPLAVQPEGGSVKVGPNATVVTPDVAASNGVIHAIDAVLIPPTVTLG
jgi:uncharacterized surface protein with fasciclin (FAS1) repeats